MADLITRESVLEALAKASIGGSITDRINAIPAVNRWISVEDALPEKAGEYLCTLYYAMPPYNLFHPELDHYIRTVSVQRFDGKSFIASVIAWMPMPDAYEPPESEVQ